jgi:hypothetical protein
MAECGSSRDETMTRLAEHRTSNGSGFFLFSLVMTWLA